MIDVLEPFAGPDIRDEISAARGIKYSHHRKKE